MLAPSRVGLHRLPNGICYTVSRVKSRLVWFIYGWQFKISFPFNPAAWLYCGHGLERNSDVIRLTMPWEVQASSVFFLAHHTICCDLLVFTLFLTLPSGFKFNPSRGEQSIFNVVFFSLADKNGDFCMHISWLNAAAKNIFLLFFFFCKEVFKHILYLSNKWNHPGLPCSFHEFKLWTQSGFFFHSKEKVQYSFAYI